MLQHNDGNGLIAHWSFNEGIGRTVEDSVSNRNDPINYVFNEAIYQQSSDPQWREGIKGKALLFDGYSTWISRSAQNIEAPTSALTVQAWVAPRCFGGIDDDQLSAIVNQHNRESREGYIFGMFKHGTWSFQIGANGEWIEAWCIDRPLPEKEWSHIAATFDRDAALIKLYLNGEKVCSQPTPENSSISIAHEDLLIGKNNHGKAVGEAFTLNMFNGLLDEVKVYNKPLTDQEVSQEYKSDLAPFNGEIPPIPYDALKLDRTIYDQDRHRPQYHLTPPGHWMNEPHAPIYFNGQYHLFYQHNPQGPYWGYLHWGHWVSEDLVHWRDLPVALTPERDAIDPDGDWSGSACYDENGVPALFFTAGDNRKNPNQMIGLAKSTFLDDQDNDLVNWVKHPKPITLQPENCGLREEDFRDPFVWKEEDTWYQIVGTGIEGKGGTATVFTSKDLLNWEYKGFLYETNYQQYPYLGPIWELPILLPIGKDSNGNSKHIFIISPVGEGADVEVFYWIGKWDKQTYRFIPEHNEPRLIDVGDFHFTGPSGMIDPTSGRLLLFTIAQGERTTRAEYDSGWAHNGGLPISLSLREDGRLNIEPIQELQSLRHQELLSFENKTRQEANTLLKDIKGDMLEIKVVFGSGNASSYGIKVRQSPDEEEETLLYYSKEKSMLQVNREKTTIDSGERSRGIQGGRLNIGEEELSLHIYLDRSMIEVYANSLKSLTTRAYPARKDSLGLSLYADGNIQIKKMKVWELKGIHNRS